MSHYLDFIKKGFVAGSIIAVFVLCGWVVKNSVLAASPRECDSNAVLYCGATNVKELVNDYKTKDNGRYQDVHAIYSSFGISSADIDAIPKRYKMGQVRADGSVWIGSQQIGSGAVTAGRTNKAGSTAIAGTGAFKRSTSVAFSTPTTSIDAIIGFKNGKPAWAVLTSCGNPVTWQPVTAPTPVAKPKLNIDKTLKNPNGNAWVDSANFSNGHTITYRLVVSNSSKAVASNVTLRDTLPSGQRFVAGSVRLNGVLTKATNNNLIITSKGLNIGNLNPGASAELTFQAKAFVPADKCGNNTFTNKASASAAGIAVVEDSASGNIGVACASVKCDQMTASSASILPGQAITFTVAAAVSNSGAPVYEFTVNGKVVQSNTSNTLSHVFNSAGRHTVRATVISGSTRSTSGACAKHINVQKPQVTATCKSLRANRLGLKIGESTTLVAAAEVQNANLKSYQFKVNGKQVQNTTSNTYVFKAEKSGSYTTTVVLITDRGNFTAASCSVKINVASEPKCPYNTAILASDPSCQKPVKPCPYNSGLTAEDVNCVKPKPACAYDHNLTSDDVNCVKPTPAPSPEPTPEPEPEPTPAPEPEPQPEPEEEQPSVKGEATTLPDTGPGTSGVIAVAAIVTLAGAAAHATFVRKMTR